MDYIKKCWQGLFYSGTVGIERGNFCLLDRVHVQTCLNHVCGVAWNNVLSGSKEQPKSLRRGLGGDPIMNYTTEYIRIIIYSYEKKYYFNNIVFEKTIPLSVTNTCTAVVVASAGFDIFI